MKTKLTNKFTVYTPKGVTSSLCGSSVISLGTFDGVHVAHRALLDESVKLKNHLGAALVGAWCFSSPPASYLGASKVFELTQIEQKVSLLLSCGLDFVAVGDFNDYRSIEAEAFVRETLISSLSCVGVVCGYDHRFGYKGAGNEELLRSIFEKDAVISVPKIDIDGITVSSSEIRSRLFLGDVEGACMMLGRPYSITSSVESGKKLGRRIGFPTANQFFPDGAALLNTGIYAVRCITEKGESYMGTANVGIRPSIDDSIDNHKLNCETYIHGYTGELYGQSMTVEFLKRLRDEMRFPNLDALKAAIANDVEETVRYFSEK